MDYDKQIAEAPVYRHPAEYAREHGELESYRASRKLNIACKEAIEAAIPAHYSDNRLASKEAVQQVVSQFGFDRTAYVLAITVREKEWDGRISPQNKEWAKTIPVTDDNDPWGQNKNRSLAVDSVHPGLTDLFVNRVRKEISLQQELSAPGKETKKTTRPSIKEQLAAPPVSSKPPTTKPKEEVR